MFTPANSPSRVSSGSDRPLHRPAGQTHVAEPTPSDRSTALKAVQEQVLEAVDAGTTVEITGGCTKGRLGRRETGAKRLDVSGLDQLISYEPGELVLVVQPGMRLAAVEELLSGENQHLAFEPPQWGDGATVGGTVACGLSGPRRFKAGAARDFVLGIELIDGCGQRIRAGGRVVKNVTGYDLSRALTGSFGTLGVLTEICLKLWPRPETQATLVVDGCGRADALALMLEWAALPLEITGLAYLPEDGSTSGRLMARIEGPGAAVAEQMRSLAEGTTGAASTLEESESAHVWKQLRELELLQPNADEQLWRFSLAPAQALLLVGQLEAHDLRRYCLDWGGGQVWALFPARVPPATLHRAALRLAATAWRFARGPEDANDEAFTPLSPGVHRLNQRLKRAMDPKGVFSPGRMYRPS